MRRTAHRGQHPTPYFMVLQKLECHWLEAVHSISEKRCSRAVNQQRSNVVNVILLCRGPYTQLRAGSSPTPRHGVYEQFAASTSSLGPARLMSSTSARMYWTQALATLENPGALFPCGTQAKSALCNAATARRRTALPLCHSLIWEVERTFILLSLAPTASENHKVTRGMKKFWFGHFLPCEREASRCDTPRNTTSAAKKNTALVPPLLEASVVVDRPPKDSPHSA